MTLTEKALTYKPKNQRGRPPLVLDEMIDLSIAWAQGRVTLGQCVFATKLGDTTLYGRLACSLRAAVHQGKLVNPNDVRGWK